MPRAEQTLLVTAVPLEPRITHPRASCCRRDCCSACGLYRPLPLDFKNPRVLEAKARGEGEQRVMKEEDRRRSGVVAMRSSGC
jgi:hypothetical protein